jgi:filamentous hemagglutinin family protein
MKIIVNRVWEHQIWRWFVVPSRGWLGVLPLGIALLSSPAFAQIVPDTTLGTERSQVIPNVNVRGFPAERIDGGATRGSALFHSFSEFNVNEGQRLYFSNPTGITDILTRVTGANVSNILGTLGVDGGANLFLLNPNGILFGSNARLDIQGSFLATTANRFVFPNGTEFGATNPQAPPLLTMSVPIGVQYGTQAGNITNAGNLTVGKNLTLLAGGGITLQPGSKIDTSNPSGLGGSVTLVSNGDTRITNSTINSKSNNSSDDDFSNIRIESTNGSVFLNEATLTVDNDGSAEAGDIFIDASDRIEIENSTITANGDFGLIFVGNNSDRPGVDLTLPKTVVIANSTLKTTNNRNDSSVAGDIFIDASDYIQITNSRKFDRDSSTDDARDRGVSVDGDSGRIFIGYNSENDTSKPQTVEISNSDLNARNSIGSSGNSGDIKIQSGSLLVDNSILNAATFGAGKGGDVNINVDTVSLNNNTLVFSSVGKEPEATGKAGDIIINTGSLLLANNSVLNSATDGPGNAGNVSITARESVSLQQRGRIYSSVESSGTGNAGSVTITAPHISLENKSGISVNNAPNNFSSNISDANQAKLAGDIKLASDTLTLKNESFISADTINGLGGNIDIEVKDFLLLRHSSYIETTAKTDGLQAQTDGTQVSGGRITLNKEKNGFVIAVPSENSDILATAFGGQGGAVQINALQVFGLERRSGLNRNELLGLRTNNTSDINAGSDTGSEGSIQINTLSVDPSQGLTALPIDLIDPSNQISRSCGASANRQNQFVVTGRGGLPPSPNDLQTSGAMTPGWVTRESTRTSRASAKVEPPTPTVEAQVMMLSAQGNLRCVFPGEEFNQSSSFP